MGGGSEEVKATGMGISVEVFVNEGNKQKWQFEGIARLKSMFLYVSKWGGGLVLIARERIRDGDKGRQKTRTRLRNGGKRGESTLGLRETGERSNHEALFWARC